MPLLARRTRPSGHAAARPSARDDRVYCIQHAEQYQDLYTRYPIVARRAWPAGQVHRALGRARRASKGILHTISGLQKCLLISFNPIITEFMIMTLISKFCYC